MMYYCIAQRGRGNNNEQRFEMRVDGLVSTLTSVQKDTMIAILTKARTELGKEVRRHYRNDIGVPFNGDGNRCYVPRKDGISNTVTSFPHDNMVMTDSETIITKEDMEYKQNPTKEDLLEYFGSRIAVRKLHQTEAFRLMNVSDEDIEKIQAYPWSSFAEREEELKGLDEKERNKIMRQRGAISKTAQYKLAGNSIVCGVLVAIFENLFISTSNNKSQRSIQLKLF